jgi:hypothetical protein
MKLDRYPFTASPDRFQYEFISMGPKGSIRKIVRFDEIIMSFYQKVFNLAIGDWNEDRQSINNGVVSNNEDTAKLLATIAHIAKDFTNHFPGSMIYAAGSTASRTRKYQMALNREYDEVNKLFLVFGMTKEGEILPFQKNVNYTGFLARRRPMKNG